MNTYTTLIRTIDPKDGELKTWGGPYVKGISRKDAEHYCQTHGLGYCEVSGILVAEVTWEGEISNYDAQNN